MPVISKSTDVSGRTRDMLIMPGLDPFKGTPQAVTLEFGKVSQFCAGVQKVVQRYMISLLTNLGSQGDFPGFGTDLLFSISNTALNPSALDIQHIFNFANYKVISEFREYQREHPDLPEDEQLDSAGLEDVSVSGDYINFRVRIYTVAGDTINFIVPLPQVN